MSFFHGGLRGFSLAISLSGLCCAFAAGSAAASETIIYSQGFESSNGNFTHAGTLDKWEWGTPSAAFTPGPPAAHSGSKCWGTDLDDTVPFLSDAYLTSPAITLPTIGTNQVMRVRFFGWIAVDLMADRGQFQVSSDGLDWKTVAELFCTMQGGWNNYEFDVSEYAGGSFYLRFRCTADDQNEFSPPEAPQNMAGFYVDDIAITVTDAPTIKKTLTFEGTEYQEATASCPWIYIQGKKKYEQENDIYSTAKGSSREYTDYYHLNKALSADKDGKFVIKLKETEQEESYTDLFHLLLVDHSASVDIACDENGNAFTYKKSQTSAPSAAVDKNGASVISRIADADENGYKAYNGDYIDLDFSSIGNASHPIFLLRAQGFKADTQAGTYLTIQPKIEVQTQNSSGVWITRNVFYPRWLSAFSGYDMNGFFPYAKKIRLLSSSCMTGKYHLIDWTAISTQSQKSVTITDLAPDTAIRSDGINVTAGLSAADGNRTHMASGEEITLTFTEPSKANGNKRDFVVKSKGYYNPTGTFFFYTWDGSKWAQRDALTVSTGGDQTKEFDVSLWLPDPEGKNRVRIWQDFCFYPASIDYVGLRRDSIDCIMNYALDLRDTTPILDRLNRSDDDRLSWDWSENWPLRSRWVEVGWVDTFVNTPPSTSPVFVTNTNSPTPVVNWTYFDLDNNSQNQYEIEVWSGPNGTGSNLWDPPAGQGKALSELYAGTPLASGQEYFARVKAFDSLSWGGWSEAAFTVSSNHPPVAEAGPDLTVTASPSCVTSVALDGSASYDSDGDTLSFLWTGAFGNAEGSKPAVFLYPGTYLVKLIVSDNNGGSGMDSMTIVVRDLIAPVPDAASLPQITGECAVSITNPPTATDNCAGQIVGTTDSLTFAYPGTFSVTWRYDDGQGNIATQLQTVVVSDNSAPVPDITSLPPLSGQCFLSVTEFPTATDNCSGQIVGTTTDPLSYSTRGTSTITWRYVDASGNAVTQQQTVTVTDQTPPVPDVSPLPTLDGSCSITITQFPTALDNCMGTVVGTTTDPLTYSNTGAYTITWRYDDGNGNIATQTQSVIVADHTPPVPDVAQLPAVQGNCWVYICAKPTATDDCRGKIIATTADPLYYTHNGTYVITWRYDDGNGNIATQTQTVIVADNIAPVPNVAQLPVIQGNCMVSVCSKPTATDNCKGLITATTTDPLLYTRKGTYVIHWNYNDGNGNTSSQTQTVNVVDNAAPVPNVGILPAITGYIHCGRCFTITCYPTATDNCKGRIVGTTSSPLTYCYRGNFVITWKYNDGNGNITTQNQTVYIR